LISYIPLEPKRGGKSWGEKAPVLSIKNLSLLRKRFGKGGADLAKETDYRESLLSKPLQKKPKNGGGGEIRARTQAT